MTPKWCVYWELLSDGAPDHYTDHQNILKHLLDIYAPEITIKAECSVPHQADEQTINVEKNAIKVEGKPGYYAFTHTRKSGSFRIKAVNYGSVTISGLTSQDVLEDIMFYYHGDSLSFDNLMVGTVKKDGGDKYVHYI